MSGVDRTTKRYSESFKLHVVSQVENDKLSIYEARRVYGIGGVTTIHSWLEKYGKGHLINRAVFVKMRNESDRIKQLEADKQKLESALAQTQLKVLTLESLIEVAEEHYRIEIKKNCGSNVPKEVSGK